LFELNEEEAYPVVTLEKASLLMNRKVSHRIGAISYFPKSAIPAISVFITFLLLLMLASFYQLHETLATPWSCKISSIIE